MHYYGEPVVVEMAQDNDNSMQIGNALLARAGLELVRIVAARPIPEFKAYVIKKWQESGYTVVASPQQGAANG
jgi:hypothetical protein